MNIILLPLTYNVCAFYRLHRYWQYEILYLIHLADFVAVIVVFFILWLRKCLDDFPSQEVAELDLELCKKLENSDFLTNRQIDIASSHLSTQIEKYEEVISSK